MPKLLRGGVTRDVILIGRLAFKLPKMTGSWRQFLLGLLANMQERTWSTTRWPGLCPVVFSLPGGFLVVMRRAHPLTDQEWATLNVDTFCDREEFCLPVEGKRDSFGVLDGAIVAVDYGS